jgi:hypothetical protein
MATVLRYGLETNPAVLDRVEFLQQHRLAWTLGWLTWQAAALSILWYFFCFVRAHQPQSADENPVLKLAVVLAAAGIVPDLIAESLWMAVLPELAKGVSKTPAADFTQLERFELLHRCAVVLSGYLANGLYTLATIIATWSTRRTYALPITASGMAVGVFGTVLSASALVNSASGMFWSNVGLLPAILIWQVGVALHAGREHKRAAAAVRL